MGIATAFITLVGIIKELRVLMGTATALNNHRK